MHEYSACKDFYAYADLEEIQELIVVQGQNILMENDDGKQFDDESILKANRGGVYLNTTQSFDENFYGFSSIEEPEKSQVALCLLLTDYID